MYYKKLLESIGIFSNSNNNKMKSNSKCKAIFPTLRPVYAKTAAFDGST